jgi:hypothetical protein
MPARAIVADFTQGASGALFRAVAAAVVLIVKVLVAVPPAGFTLAGLKVQLASLGNEPQEKLIVPLYPPVAVTVIVNVADWPGLMVADSGWAWSAKSGLTTTIVTVGEVLAAFAPSPP